MIILYISVFILLLFALKQNGIREHFASRDKKHLIIDPYNRYTIDDNLQLRPNPYLNSLANMLYSKVSEPTAHDTYNLCKMADLSKNTNYHRSNLH